MIFVDTTFFLAILDHRDSLHSRAIAWATHLAAEQKLTTEYVLLEVVNSLCRIPDRPRAVRFLQRVQQLPDLSVVWAGEVEFMYAMQLFERRLDHEWSLTDCSSMEVMRRFAITKALTHDHHFEQAGYEALLRRDPA